MIFNLVLGQDLCLFLHSVQDNELRQTDKDRHLGKTNHVFLKFENDLT